MSFQTKTFLSIVASMLNRMRSITTLITDYNIGSVARTLVEAPAQEIDQLYQQMVQGLLEGIQTSVYTSFSFPPLQATGASGLIRVMVEVQAAAIVIPAGTTLTRVDGSFSYISTNDVTIAAGATFVDVPVVGTKTGTSGNSPALNEFTLGFTVPGLTLATNLAAFVNGRGPETAAAQKVRFNAYIQTLSRGTVAALRYALENLVTINDTFGNVLERVASANIVEPYLTNPTISPGLVLAYIDNGVGSTSQALVIRALAVLQGYEDANGNPVAGWVAAGVQLDVFIAAQVPVSVTGALVIGPTYDPAVVVAQVTAVLYTYIRDLPVGEPYLAFEANELVAMVNGVWNWTPVSPQAYVSVSPSAKLVPGAFSIIGWLAANTVVRTSTAGVLT